MVSGMQSVTIGISDLPRALHLFHDVMGLAIESRARLSRARLDAWGLKGVKSGEIVELSCKGYGAGRLRLLHLTPTPTSHVRLDPTVGGPDTPLDIGPKAVDFYVRPPAAVYWQELVDAGCIARSKPVRHTIGGADSEEAVLFGPDGVPLLIMVGHNHPPEDLRPGAPHGKYSEAATISVVAGDLAASRKFYGEGLGLEVATDSETPDEFREKVNELVGIPRGSRMYFLMYRGHGEPSGKILLVHFKTGLPERRLTGRMHPSRLGVTLFTHTAPDLDTVAARLSSCNGRIELPPTRVDGARLMLVRGPNEELFEIVEQD